MNKRDIKLVAAGLTISGSIIGFLDNVVLERISVTLNAYRRQKDRMVDIMDQMKRIVSGG